MAASEPLLLAEVDEVRAGEVWEGEGDFCAIPEHHEQAVVNRAIDSGRV